MLQCHIYPTGNPGRSLDIEQAYNNSPIAPVHKPTLLYHGMMQFMLAMLWWKVLQQLGESKAVWPMHYLVYYNTMGSDMFSNGLMIVLSFAYHAIQSITPFLQL